MNILVTGASGFIGQYLVRHLLETTSHSITGISRSKPDMEDDSYTHLGLDMTRPGWTSDISGAFDVIIHLAQSEYYRDFPDHADELYSVNVHATFELLEWCRQAGVRKFIYSSTGNVYSPGRDEFSEDDECTPASMYAATKLSAEHLAMQYAGFFNVIVMRLFGVYGPGQAGMLIPTMIERIRKGEEIQLAAGKGIYINPVYVTDCTRYIGYFAEADITENYLVVNLGGGEVLSLYDIVTSIGDEADKEPVIRNTEGKPARFVGNIQKLKEITGLSPETPFSDGIRYTVSNT